jgi:hypothetical protein
VRDKTSSCRCHLAAVFCTHGQCEVQYVQADGSAHTHQEQYRSRRQIESSTTTRWSVLRTVVERGSKYDTIQFLPHSKCTVSLWPTT